MTCIRMSGLSILGLLIMISHSSSYVSSPQLARKPTPPDQPVQGPAGTQYVHGSVRHTIHGQGLTIYHLFEPADPKPQAAEVLVYFHAKNVIIPDPYLGVIMQTVRMGYTVVFHNYGEIPGEDIQPGYDLNSAATIKDALQILRSPGHVPPKSNRVSLACHSSGCWVLLFMAKQWSKYDLPEIAAIMLHDPTTLQKMYADPDTLTELYPIFGYEMRNIPPRTFFVYITCEETRKYHEMVYNRNFFAADWPYFDHILCDRKNFFEIPSDYYGYPALISAHITGITNVGSIFLDQIDYGFWKLSVGLLNLAYQGTNGDYVIGNGPRVRDMQSWSDGRPVNLIRTAVEFFGGACPPAGATKR